MNPAPERPDLITSWFFPHDTIQSQWGTLEASMWAEKEAARMRAKGRLVRIVYHSLDHTIALADAALWQPSEGEHIYRQPKDAL